MSWAELPQDILYYELELPPQVGLVCKNWEHIPIEEYYWKGNVNLAARARKLIFGELHEDELGGIKLAIDHNRFLRKISLEFTNLSESLYPMFNSIVELTIHGVDPNLIPKLSNLRELRILNLDVIPDLDHILTTNPVINLTIKFDSYFRKEIRYLDFRPYQFLKELYVENILALPPSELHSLIVESPTILEDEDVDLFFITLAGVQSLYKLYLYELSYNNYQPFLRLLKSLKYLQSLTLLEVIRDEDKDNFIYDLLNPRTDISKLKHLQLDTPLEPHHIELLPASLKSIYIEVKWNIFPELQALPKNITDLRIKISFEEEGAILNTLNFLPMRQLHVLELSAENYKFDKDDLKHLPWQTFPIRNLILKLSLQNILPLLLDNLKRLKDLEELTIYYNEFSLTAVNKLISLLQQSHIHYLNLIHIYINEKNINKFANYLLQNKDLRKVRFMSEYADPDMFIPIIKRRESPIEIILFEQPEEVNEYTYCNGSILKY